MRNRGLWFRGAMPCFAASFIFLAAFSLSLAGEETVPAALIEKIFPAQKAREILGAVEKLDELKKAAADQLQIRIGGGFSENIVPNSLVNLAREPKELSKLNLSSSISKGFFPNEVTFITDNSFQLEDGAIKENVTKLLLNYEYYFRPWLEGYVFVERFSDSYLSIQQRYEIGTGLKLEAEIPFVFQKDCGQGLFQEHAQVLDRALKDLEVQENKCYGPELLAAMKQGLKAMKGSLDDPGLQKRIHDLLEMIDALLAPERAGIVSRERDVDYELMGLIVGMKNMAGLEESRDIAQKWLEEKTLTLAELRQVKGFLQEQKSILSSPKVKEALVTWRKKKAFLGLGLAFSLFSEIEKAEIKEEIVKDAWETISLPATHRLRWIIRPSFELRPFKAISLKGHFYFKEFLWEPNGKNRRSNTRQDHYLRLDYELPTSTAWAKALTFFLAYEYHRDSLPPRIPNDTLEELATRYGIGAESINPSADKKHYVLSLGVEIKF